MTCSCATAVAFLPALPFVHQRLGATSKVCSRTSSLHGSRSAFRSSSFAGSTRIRVFATANADEGVDDETHSHTSGETQPPAVASSTPGSPPPAYQESRPEPQASSYRPRIDYELQSGEVGVRFINGPSGSDVIAAAKPGDNILAVGDSVGVRIPRACQSGLCGSCTCDVLDATQPEGRQTVRACQTGVEIPDGGPELIIDVSRMKSFKKERDPMSRFENLDTGYVAGAAPKRSVGSGSRIFSRECSDCNGTGQVICEDCDGSGTDTIHGTEVCLYCVGMRYIRCATCQGTGEMHVRR